LMAESGRKAIKCTQCGAVRERVPEEASPEAAGIAPRGEVDR
jgi:hypothetical protein